MNRINRPLSTGSIAIGRAYWTLGAVEDRTTKLRCQKSRRRAQQPSGHKHQTFARLGPDKIRRAMRKLEEAEVPLDRSRDRAGISEEERSSDSPVTVSRGSVHKVLYFEEPLWSDGNSAYSIHRKINSDKPSLPRATYTLSLARPHIRSPAHFSRPVTRRRYWSEKEWFLTFR
jgi:hypothetical protein